MAAMHKQNHLETNASKTSSIFGPAKLLLQLKFGFRFKISTNNAIMFIIKNIQSSLDLGKFTGEIFIDLRKTFDTVGEDILINKLEHDGVRVIPKWFRTSFKEKKHFVSFGNFTSSTKDVLASAPQSSIQGPLLFP